MGRNGLRSRLWAQQNHTVRGRDCRVVAAVSPVKAAKPLEPVEPVEAEAVSDDSDDPVERAVLGEPQDLSEPW